LLNHSSALGLAKGILVLRLRSEITGQAIGEWRLNRLNVPTTVMRQGEAEREEALKGSGVSCDANVRHAGAPAMPQARTAKQ
jgi:hypothetical protein